MHGAPDRTVHMYNTHTSLHRVVSTSPILYGINKTMCRARLRTSSERQRGDGTTVTVGKGSAHGTAAVRSNVRRKSSLSCLAPHLKAPWPSCWHALVRDVWHEVQHGKVTMQPNSARLLTHALTLRHKGTQIARPALSKARRLRCGCSRASRPQLRQGRTASRGGSKASSIGLRMTRNEGWRRPPLHARHVCNCTLPKRRTCPAWINKVLCGTELRSAGRVAFARPVSHPRRARLRTSCFHEGRRTGGERGSEEDVPHRQRHVGTPADSSVGSTDLQPTRKEARVRRETGGAE